MQYLTVESLPKMRFAHIFGVDSYQYEFKPLHHTVEITYISKGQLHCVSDKEDFVLKQGDILFNAYLYPLRVEASEYHEHHTVSFQLEFGISDTPTDLSVPMVAHLSSERCLKVIDEIIRAHTIYADSNLRVAGLCLQLLYEMSASTEQSTVNQGIRQYVKKVKNYTFQHIREPIRQADIADALGITPEYLCYVFKQCEKTTVMAYVNRIKLESIRSLMEKENLPLYKAAEFFGYSDPNYVSRLYKKLFQFNITDGLLKDKPNTPI